MGITLTLVFSIPKAFGTSVALVLGQKAFPGRNKKKRFSGEGTKIMSKQLISVDGEEVVVREDTAKAYRGVYWALLSIAGFVLVAGVLFFSGLLEMATDPTPNPSPTRPENTVTDR